MPVLNMKQAVYYGLFILVIFIFKINSHLTFAESVNNIKKNIVSSISQIKELSIQKVSADLTLSANSFIVSVNSSNRDIVVTVPRKKYFIKKKLLY